MLIISQNKKEIINLNNVTRFFIDESENKTYLIGADTNSAEAMVWELGEYETEERAKEVLALIYKVYSDQTLIKHIRGDMQIETIAGDKNKYFDVFEMPKI